MGQGYVASGGGRTQTQCRGMGLDCFPIATLGPRSPITHLGSHTRAGVSGISWASPRSAFSRTGERFLGADKEEGNVRG